MSRKDLIVGVGAFLALAVVFAVVFQLKRVPPPSYPEQLRISYGFVVTNTTNRAIAGGRFWTLAPLQETPWQRLLELDSSLSPQVVVDAAGNQVLEFDLPMIPPYGSQEVRVDALLGAAEAPNRWPSPDAAHLLASSPGIEFEHASVAAATAAATGGRQDPLQAIHDWVVRSLTPVPYDAQDRGALHALQEKRGDCSEFAYLVTAMARKFGRPARVVEGWAIDADTVLEGAGYHAWAEVWDGETWRKIDAHATSVGNTAAHRVGFRVVPHQEDAFSAAFTRFRIEGAGLTARMK